MQTNKRIQKDSHLYDAAKALLAAAYEYWQIYHDECGLGAVVWLEDDSGHFVLFTRGEYKDAILQGANADAMSGPALFKPFENPGQPPKGRP